MNEHLQLLFNLFTLAVVNTNLARKKFLLLRDSKNLQHTVAYCCSYMYLSTFEAYSIPYLVKVLSAILERKVLSNKGKERLLEYV